MGAAVMTERTETPITTEPLTNQQINRLVDVADSIRAVTDEDYHENAAELFDLSDSDAIEAALARLRYLETARDALVKMLERTTDQLDSFDGCAPSEALTCDTCNLIDEANELMASLSPLPAQAAKDGE